jgi:hypothetical protein
VTATSLLNDLMILLSRVSGGRNGNNLLAPNTLSQYGNILLVLGRDIQMNAWVQQLFAKFIPIGSFFATVSQIIDQRIANATPSGLVAPHGVSTSISIDFLPVSFTILIQDFISGLSVSTTTAVILVLAKLGFDFFVAQSF